MPIITKQPVKGVRVYNSGPNVDQWDGDGSSIFDVCINCAEEMKDDPEGTHQHPRLQPFNGDPVGTEWEFDETDNHPPYDEVGYKCDMCRVPLTDED